MVYSWKDFLLTNSVGVENIFLLAVRLILHFLLALCNPLDSFGPSYASVNILSGRISTGHIDLQEWVFVPDIVKLRRLTGCLVVTFSILSMSISLEVIIDDLDVEGWVEIKDWIVSDPIPVPSGHREGSGGSGSSNASQLDLAQYLQIIKKASLEVRRGSISVNGSVRGSVTNLHLQAVNGQYQLSLHSLEVNALQSVRSSFPETGDLLHLSGVSFSFEATTSRTHIALGTFYVNVDQIAASTLEDLLTRYYLLSCNSLKEIERKRREHRASFLHEMERLDNQLVYMLQSGNLPFYYDDEESIFYEEALDRIPPVVSCEQKKTENCENQCSVELLVERLLLRTSVVDGYEEALVITSTSIVSSQSAAAQVFCAVSVRSIDCSYAPLSSLSRSGQTVGISPADVDAQQCLTFQYDKKLENAGRKVLVNCKGSLRLLSLCVSGQAVLNLQRIMAVVGDFVEGIRRKDVYEHLSISSDSIRSNCLEMPSSVVEYGSIHLLWEGATVKVHLNDHSSCPSITREESTMVIGIGAFSVSNMDSCRIGCHLTSCTVTAQRYWQHPVDLSQSYALDDSIIIEHIFEMNDLRVVSNSEEEDVLRVQIIASTLMVYITPTDLSLLANFDQFFNQRAIKTTGKLKQSAWKLLKFNGHKGSEVSFAVGRLCCRGIYINPAHDSEHQLSKTHGPIYTDLVIYDLANTEGLSIFHQSWPNQIATTNVRTGRSLEVSVRRFPLKPSSDHHTSKHSIHSTHNKEEKTSIDDNANPNCKTLFRVMSSVCEEVEDQSNRPWEEVEDSAIKITLSTTLAEVHCVNSHSLALGYFHHNRVFCFTNSTIVFDYYDLYEGLLILRSFQPSSRLNDPEGSIPHLIDVDSASWESSIRVDDALQQPDQIISIAINRLHITAQHLYKPVLYICSADLSCSTVVFQDHSYQLNGRLTSLSLSDLSADYAIHKTIISSVDKDNGVLNEITFHYSSIQPKNQISNEVSQTADADTIIESHDLLEIQVDHLRLVYLHRAIFTVLCYILDHLIKDIYEVFSEPSNSRSAVETTTPTPPKLPLYKGLFRFVVSIRHSEVHVPNNSCAMEALVVLFKQLNLYRTNDFHSSTARLRKYSQGPLLRQIALYDGYNVRSFQSALDTCCQGNVNHKAWRALPILTDLNWNLLTHREEIFVQDLPVYTLCQSYLLFDLLDATLCSWCNNNIVCAHQDLSIKFYIYQITPLGPGQGCNLSIWDYIKNEDRVDEVRNTIVVSITSDEVNWVLSQGQYWAVLNLIQQNFSELQEHVIDPYQSPPYKDVKLGEEAYGKYAIDKYLPIINSVPIQIHKGKIAFIFNESLYYERFLLPAPRAPIFSLYQGHNIDYELAETLPSVDHLLFVRNQCYKEWNVIDENHATPMTATDYKTMYNLIYNLHREEAESSPFCLIFEDLYVDFYRKHFGGGNGIEAYANSFLVLGVDDDMYDTYDPLNPNRDDIYNIYKLFEEVNIKNMVMAPKTCPYLHQEGNTRSTTQKADSNMSKGNVYFDALDISELEEAANTPTSSASVAMISDDEEPPKDNGNGKESEPLRLNEYAYHHMYPPVYPDINEINARYNSHLQLPTYTLSSKPLSIHDPVFNNDHLYGRRYPHLRYSQQGMNNLRRCAIFVQETVVVAHFHIVMSVVKYFNHPVKITFSRNETIVRRNHEKEFDYHESLDVEVEVQNTLTFIPNYHDPHSSSQGTAMEQSGTPLNASKDSENSALKHHHGFHGHSHHHRGQDEDCTGLGINANVSYKHAWRGFLLSGPGTAHSSLSATLLNMFIAPLYECNVTQIISLIDTLLIEFSLAYHIHPTESKYYHNHHLLLGRVAFDDWVGRINKLDRPSADRYLKFAMKQDELEEGSKAEDDSLTGGFGFITTSDQSPANLRSKFSIKDIEFVLTAINKFRQSIQKQILKAPKKDHYHHISRHIADICHLPDLTCFLVTTELDPGLHTDIKQVDSEIHNIDIVVRNNTYNLNILNFIISDIRLNYMRSTDDLRLLAGVKLSLSSYNDTLESWEPILEPVHIHGKGSTDVSSVSMTQDEKNDESNPSLNQKMSTSNAPTTANVEGEPIQHVGLMNASKIRIEVNADRVELNAAQSSIANLLYKLQLNDVVTTSSNRLPPYKIINQLGADIHFNIGYNGGIVINNTIQSNASLPIEINQLTFALNTYKQRKLYNSSHATNLYNNNLARRYNREYLLWISFLNFQDAYESQSALSIDKVGTTAFEMVKTNRRQSITHSLPSYLSLVKEDEESEAGTSTGYGSIRYVSEVPLTLLQMQILPNGIRELYIRSVLSIHNSTQRTMYISIKLFGSSVETCLHPNKVYYVPVRFANPKASLLIRFANASSVTSGLSTKSVDNSELYYEVMHCLSAFIAQGSWGNPQRLRAHLCLCPDEDHAATNPNDVTVNSSAAASAQSLNWLVMLKPEVRPINALTAANAAKNTIPIRYPSKETYSNKIYMKDNHAHNVNITTTPAMHAPIKVISSSNIHMIKPVCIHIQAPLVFCNLLPQPMLYKLGNDSNQICAEGLLLPGQVVDIYNLSSMFNSKLYISLRLCNYCWSKWYVLCTRTTPYSANEKLMDITLQPLQFKPISLNQLHADIDRKSSGKDKIAMNLPSLDITVVNKEYLVRFTCQIILSNATKLPLLGAETARPESFVFISPNGEDDQGNSQAFNSSKTGGGGAGGKNAVSMRVPQPLRGFYRTNDVLQIPGATSTPQMTLGSSYTIEEGKGEDDTSDSSEYTTPSTVPADSAQRAINSNIVTQQLYTLNVFMPYDHMKKIRTSAYGEATLEEVFNHVKPQLSSIYQYVDCHDYFFFPYVSAKQLVNIAADVVMDSGETDETGSGSNSAGASSDATPSVPTGNATPPKGIFRSRSARLSMETVRPSSDAVIPSHLRYNMSVDLAEPLSIYSPVHMLTTYDLLLIHKAEYSIYAQSQRMVIETTESSNGLFQAVFGKSKTYSYTTDYFPLQGSIPYRPHRMLNFHSHLSIKDLYNVDWSNGIDVVKTDFDIGDMIVSVKSKHLNYSRDTFEEDDISRNNSNSVAHYELGTYIERGRGLLQHSTIVTFVPKRILVSKLPFDIRIRQTTAVNASYSSSTENVVVPIIEITLRTGKTLDYYFVNKPKNPLIEIKRCVGGGQEADWFGELDICHLGIVYIKLRQPLLIVRVETEIVGASYVSTFTEQSLIWPPYRILNSSNMMIRFKQAAPDNNSSSIAATQAIPYDVLQPKQSVAYAWDFPQTISDKIIRIEVQHRQDNYVGKNIDLYSLYSNNQMDHIVIKKFIPNIGNPLGEGYLLHSASGLMDSYQKVYCILRPDTLYLYEDESRNVLIDIIHLSYEDISNKLIKYATVSKHFDTKNTLFTNFFNKPTMTPKASGYDINFVRAAILKVANYLQCFAHFPMEKLQASQRARAASHESQHEDHTEDQLGDSTERPTIADSSDSSPTPPANSSTSLHALFGGLTDSSSASVQDQEDGSSPQVQSEDNAIVSAAGATQPDVALSNQSLNLHGLLDRGASIEQLLEEVSNAPIQMPDVLTALVDCRVVENEEDALVFCEYLIAEGYLIKKEKAGEGRKSIYNYDPFFDNDNEEDDEEEEEEEEEEEGVEIKEGKRVDKSGVDHQANSSEVQDAVESQTTVGNSVVMADGPSSMPPVDSRQEATRVLAEAIHKRYNASLRKQSSERTVSIEPMNTASIGKDILDDYMHEDLLFNPPALCPELKVAMEEAEQATDRRSILNSSNTNANDEPQAFGFSIMVGRGKHFFRCSSEMEFLGWLQSCRTSIELSWKDIELAKRTVSTQSIEDFQMTLTVKVKADGSTKVLEVAEQELSPTSVAVVTSSISGKGKTTSNASNTKRTVASEVRRRTAAALLPIWNRSRRLLSSVGSVEVEPDADDSSYNDSIDRDQELLAVSFAVKAISLSLIDASPAEILYIGFNDINMGIARYFDAVKFFVTVYHIQISNQLLNPTFPVLLFARKMREGQTGKLQLPGLEGELDVQSCPNLHLYLQQRYHNLNPKTGMAKADEGHQKLWYFDVFSIWLAPLQLAVDEEIIVKLMRYGWNVRSSLVNEDLSFRGKLLKDEVTVGLESSRFLQSQLPHREVYDHFSRYLRTAEISYQTHYASVKSSLNLYFTVLKLHPLDLTLNFRPSPEVQLTNAEMAILSIVSQLDAARLCLNALIAENAFGSTTIISEIVAKHYRAAFWRQFRKFIGAADLVEGSVELVANIGTGFYDLFYEPIDGLMDEKRTFLHGLSKGGMSLASRAIGGTSAVASTISGGIGKGVSLLTLDSEFQKHRSLRRYNKTTSVSEGLMVGTQELGKNIVEGVTGIVVAPIKGWETGGGVGFGVGIAKGILGVALKPAVGVFDLASRATEGLRNSTFTIDPDIIMEMRGTYRARIPRAFGRSGLLLNYDSYAAAAQYMVDSLTGFRNEPRFTAISHLYLVRKLAEEQKSFSLALPQVSSTLTAESLNALVIQEDCKNPQETWGMRINNEYLIIVGPERMALLEILHPTENTSNNLSGSSTLSTTTATVSTSTAASTESLSNTTANKSASNPQPRRRFIWSCPAVCVEQLSCDSRGDIILSLSQSLHITGQWFSPHPTVLDKNSQNYMIFQSLLEQTVGVRRARMQPLFPSKGLTKRGIRKRYNSGIRSFILAPSSHTYRLFGCVLYEYTPAVIKKATPKAGLQMPNETTAGEGGEDGEDNAAKETSSQAMPVTADVANSAEYAERVIEKLFNAPLALQRDEESKARRREQMAKALEARRQEASSDEETDLHLDSSTLLQTVVDHASTVGMLHGKDADHSSKDLTGGLQLERASSNMLTSLDENDVTPYGLDTIEEGSESSEDEIESERVIVDSTLMTSEINTNVKEESQQVNAREELLRSNSNDSLDSIPHRVKDLQDSDDEVVCDEEKDDKLHSSKESMNASGSGKIGSREDESEVGGDKVLIQDSGSFDSADIEELQNVEGQLLSEKESQQPVTISAKEDIARSAEIRSSGKVDLNKIESVEEGMFLSFVYPLVDLYAVGPTVEENGKCYSITLYRIDHQKMRVLRRDEENEHFSEYKKNSLALLFNTLDEAVYWKNAITNRIQQSISDAVPPSPLTTEEKKKAQRYVLSMASSKQVDPTAPVEGSILSTLVLPTSDTDPELAENIKIEIGKTISNAKR